MKIIINKCWGGFSLSHKAILRYAELKKIPLEWEETEVNKKVRAECGIKKLDPYEDNIGIAYYIGSERTDDNYFYDRDIERNDRTLVKVVEELGGEADGRYARLSIVKIPNGIEWEIDDYDGMESVAEAHRTWS